MRLMKLIVAMMMVLTGVGLSPQVVAADEDLAAEIASRLVNGEPIEPSMLNEAIDAGILEQYATLRFPATVTAAAFTCGVVGFGPYFGTSPLTGTPSVYGFAYVACPVQMLMLSVTATIMFTDPATMGGSYLFWAIDSTDANAAYNVYSASATAEELCPYNGTRSTRWKMEVYAVGFAPSGQSSQTNGTGPIVAANC